jgi:head-tail adaptor
MRTSELRTPVEIQHKTKVKDEFSTTKEVWAKLTSLKCKVVTNSGRMTEQNDEKFYSNSLIIECYYRPVVKEGMRAILSGVTYKVDGITPYPYKNYMEVRLEKVNL